MISERDLIARIKGSSNFVHGRVIKGIGDDCAVFADMDGVNAGLVSTDTLVEGVHFDLGWHQPYLLGRKAAAVNLSDIAAMGGRAVFALLSIALAPATEMEFIDRFMDGFLAQLSEYGVMLAGGDTVKSANGLTLSITVFGEAAKEKVVYRSGARSGDLIWVSGFLGEAAAGLEICRQDLNRLHEWPTLAAAHLNPGPELRLGALLGEAGLLSAMIDMSDGLATDLAHICEESGVGARVAAAALPLSTEMHQAAVEFGLDCHDLALSGGEDYRLLFTAPVAVGKKLEKIIHDALGREIFCVGEIVKEDGVFLDLNGKMTRVDFQGFDHFAEPGKS